MKILAEKRQGKYYIKLYGIEHEIVIPQEVKKDPKKAKKTKEVM